MFGGEEYNQVDDGWRHCDRCHTGFTIWYDRIFDDENENNGYINDELLCESCFADVKKGGCMVLVTKPLFTTVFCHTCR